MPTRLKGGQISFLSREDIEKIHNSTLHLADLFSKESEVKWAKLGKKDVRCKAKERVDEILLRNEIEDKALNERLREIVKQAEKEILRGD